MTWQAEALPTAGKDARPTFCGGSAGRVQSPDPTGMRDVRGSGTETRPYGDEGRARVGCPTAAGRQAPAPRLLGSAQVGYGAPTLPGMRGLVGGRV